MSSPTTDVPDAIVKNSVASMKRSRYAPRIENGAAVPTDEVIFVERVLVKVTPPPAEGAPSGKEEAKPPAEKVPETGSEKPEPEKK